MRSLPSFLLALTLIACGANDHDPDANSSDASTDAGACATRTAGAWVEFLACGESFTVWVTNDDFIDEAISRIGAGPGRVPTFVPERGADCDGRPWHVAPQMASFADSTAELCDGCPHSVSDDVAYWVDTVGRYCPWSAAVVAVDDRR